MLDQTVARTPDHVALRFHGQAWPYAELDRLTGQFATALAGAGVRAGDRVALFMPNCPQLLLSYFGCFKLGAINVPLNYRYRQAEARYAIDHSGSTTLIVHESLIEEVAPLPLEALGVVRRYVVGNALTHPGFAAFDGLLQGSPAVLPAPAFDEHHPAAILYTSGTTAKPKGVTYTHGTLWQNCLIQTEAFTFTAADVHLVSTAACHAAAFTGQLLPSIYTGGTCVLTHLPEPEEVVRAIETHKVTRVQMLPAALEDVVEFLEGHPGANLASWRCCTAGGDVVPLDLHTRFRQATGFDITELYGMTEALSCITNPPFGQKKLGSIGRPVPRNRLRVVDPQDRDVPVGQTGELLIQSPAMLVGYWNDPTATAEALRGGWLHSGDLVRKDEGGDYWFVARKKEIIIRAGSNISPLEVEEVLDAHPAVHISCVLGAPDAHLGQKVIALVVLRDDVATLPSAAELREFVATRIAAYKVPEQITILPELPLNPSGKVDRKKLEAQVCK
jgi:acyl-CoA synthetase (AMP-forming)/AMP-acid ligase II